MSRQRKRSIDFVQALLTGRYQKKVTSEGKEITIWVPLQLNKYPTLPQLCIQNNKDIKEVLEREGLITPPLDIDRNIFRKSSKEKKYLRHIKKVHKSQMRKAGYDPNTRLNISAPMQMKLG